MQCTSGSFGHWTNLSRYWQSVYPLDGVGLSRNRSAHSPDFDRFRHDRSEGEGLFQGAKNERP